MLMACLESARSVSSTGNRTALSTSRVFWTYTCVVALRHRTRQ